MAQNAKRRGLGLAGGAAAATLTGALIAGCSSSSTEFPQLPPDQYGNAQAQDTLRTAANALFAGYLTLAPKSLTRNNSLPSTAEPPTGDTHKQTYTEIIGIPKSAAEYALQVTIDPTGLGRYDKKNNPHEVSSVHIAYFDDSEAAAGAEATCDAVFSFKETQLGKSAVWAWEVGPAAIDDGEFLGVSGSSPSVSDQQTQAKLDAGIASSLYASALAGTKPGLKGC